ncbi:MAG: methylmalonyl Co-A mutase-associated GTPase MeaB [Candidatus Krumholzibacteria bacterium]|jgi:LAO/AO transport system kinase|nr:methylmalonyl Co-A mutase-associated GTPase MeaB [Candidatus Krumholzibacteria bacterium]
MNRKKRPEQPGRLADIRESVDVERSALNVVPGVERADSVFRIDAAGRRRSLTTAEYVAGVLAQDRTLLARAITLVESNAPAHFEQAQEVVQALLSHRGQAVRVGITGVPGAGKSTMIEALGVRLLDRGLRVAVTAVDPSSTVTGGSVLGDKTRMQKLANDPRAFVRPSPSGGTLGGVTRKTRETIVLLEAAGYDVVLVETMGVGQAETVVREMVDFFLLVLIAGGGDELQGIKKGVIELADAIVINKADGENRQAAALARAEYAQALHYLRPATQGWQTRAFTASALAGEGIDELWRVIETFMARARQSGALAARRRGQERQWLRQLVRDQLEQRFLNHAGVGALLPELERAVADGDVSAVAAARRLLAAFDPPPNDPNALS